MFSDLNGTISIFVSGEYNNIILYIINYILEIVRFA